MVSPRVTCTIMTSLRLLLFTVLVETWIESSLATLLKFPMSFNYNENDVLSASIILRNVPIEVTDYVLYYRKDHCEVLTWEKNSPCNVPGKKGSISDKPIIIKQKLNKKSLSISLQLRKQNNITCTTKIMFQGTMDPLPIKEILNRTPIWKSKHPQHKYKNIINRLWEVIKQCFPEYDGYNPVRNTCLNKPNPCTITIDLENKCEEQTPAKFKCALGFAGGIQCESEVISDEAVHQWHQTSDENTSEFVLPAVQASKTYFTITFQKFDNNTNIFTTMSSSSSENNLQIEKYKISLLAEYTYAVIDTLRYSESKPIQFTCPMYSQYTYVGLIDSSGNKMIMFNNTMISKNFLKRYTSSKLCCIYYNVQGDHAVKYIRRFVTDIHMLIYDESLDLDEPTGNHNNGCDSTYGVLTCTSLQEKFPERKVHQWYQGYSDDSLIGTIPSAEGVKTQLKMKILKFDLHTRIFMSVKGPNSEKNTSFKIRWDTYNEYNTAKKLYFSKSSKVHFECQRNAQTGIIDPTGSRITTYNCTSCSWNLIERDHYSRLCCIYYTTHDMDTIKIIERVVKNITVLIYDDNRLTGNTSTMETTSQWQSSIHPETTKYPEVTTDSAKPETASDTNKYYIGVASVVGIGILILLMYISFKKIYRKPSNPVHELELETYATRDMVLYAALDIRPGTSPAPPRADEATYAEIIGVLKPPQTKNK